MALTAVRIYVIFRQKGGTFNEKEYYGGRNRSAPNVFRGSSLLCGNRGRFGCFLDEATNGTITSWGMLEDNGFFCDSGKQSPYYAWLYTPGGNLIMEGYVDSYRYYPAKGYASITFQTEGKNKGYYSHPSNIIMEWRGE